MSNNKLDELKNKKQENMLDEEQMESVAGGNLDGTLLGRRAFS